MGEVACVTTSGRRVGAEGLTCVHVCVCAAINKFLSAIPDSSYLNACMPTYSYSMNYISVQLVVR